MIFQTCNYNITQQLPHKKTMNLSNTIDNRNLSNQQEVQTDSETQQQAFLSKLQNVSNYLKQLALHLQATIRQPTIKDFAKSILQNFDRAMDEYNNYYIRKRIKKLFYFKIDPLAITKQQNIYVQKLYPKDKIQEANYFIKFFYVRDGDNFYRMHVEIWKHDGYQQTTNEVLSRFQKTLTLQLIDCLLSKGFINHFETYAVVLKSKRPNHMSSTKQISDINLNLMECIQLTSQAFLKQLIVNLTKQKKCHLCDKYLVYQSKVGLMMPPTVKISVKQDKATKNLIFHEPCSLKFLKRQQRNIDRHQRHHQQQNQIHQPQQYQHQQAHQQRQNG